MTCEDKASYGSSPPSTRLRIVSFFVLFLFLFCFFFLFLLLPSYMKSCTWHLPSEMWHDAFTFEFTRFIDICDTNSSWHDSFIFVIWIRMHVTWFIDIGHMSSYACDMIHWYVWYGFLCTRSDSLIDVIWIQGEKKKWIPKGEKKSESPRGKKKVNPQWITRRDSLIDVTWILGPTRTHGTDKIEGWL